MNECQDYIELDIDLEQHPWFMYCAEKINLYVKIVSGKYHLYYENPIQLFELGKQLSRNPNSKFYSDRTGFPK
jgi:hypothetical protein